jgi:hypothetical protein
MWSGGTAVVKEKNAEKIADYECMSSGWVQERHDVNVKLYGLATANQDTESATRFMERVQIADMVLTAREGQS